MTFQRSGTYNDPARPQAVVSAEQKIADVVASPFASYWLKDALKAALDRDPVDAVNDAALLASLLNDRLTEIF